jgi:hypothetical protein
MLNAKGLFAAAAALALPAALACTAPAIDYEGMVPVGSWIDGINETAGSRLDGEPPHWKFPITMVSMGRLAVAPLYLADAKDGPLRARLLIGTDGRTRKATFLGGNRGLWQAIKGPVLDVEWRFEQDGLPGPWELDVSISHRWRGGGWYGVIFSYVSYRTAKP